VGDLQRHKAWAGTSLPAGIFPLQPKCLSPHLAAQQTLHALGLGSPLVFEAAMLADGWQMSLMLALVPRLLLCSGCLAPGRQKDTHGSVLGKEGPWVK
jgi:hypothetical protein